MMSENCYNSSKTSSYHSPLLIEVSKSACVRCAALLDGISAKIAKVTTSVREEKYELINIVGKRPY